MRTGQHTISVDVVLRPGDAAGAGSHGAPTRSTTDEARWSPEQHLLAALAECHMRTYLRLAVESGLDVRQLRIRASAEVTADDAAPDSARIAAAVLRPEVTLADESRRSEADALHARATDGVVARSVGFPVTREPRMPSPEEPPSEQSGPPTFSRRLGAPIATLRPTGRPPSQVTGLPGGGRPEQAAEPTGSGEQQSFYDAVGGHETFRRIVDTFYARVAEDAEFRAMYPEEDLGPARDRLLMFLEQYWGGPRTYQERRGHPRLRMRHMPFRIDARARDTWLRHMRAAVDSAELSPLHDEILWDYLERAAHSMVNS